MPNVKQIKYINPNDAEDIRHVADIQVGRKRVDYFIHKKAPQYKWIKKIVIQGFDKIPAGFTKDGSGLAKGTGYLIVKEMEDNLGEFELTVSVKAKNSIHKSGSKYIVMLNYFDLRQAIDTLRQIKSEGYQALKESANGYLNKTFPKVFKLEESSADRFRYQKGQLGKLLKKEGLMEGLSQKDIEDLIEFFPIFLEHHKEGFTGKKKLIGILNSKEAADIFYIDKVIKEFEKKLKSKTQSEATWQKFFHAYIQIFNPTYATFFEKKNISLTGDFPDFVPIDIYGYLDIYEIKKPNTPLLVFDSSRKNYYWSRELSKAISQVENYIDSATRLAPAIEESIKKTGGPDVKIVKPRGLIIAGVRNQLKDRKMEDDFKILSNSMKNIEIILFDDILNNMKSLFERIQAKPGKKLKAKKK